MEIRRLWITLFLGFICLSSEAQTVYTYNGKCRIELPDKLELQDSELNNVKRLAAQGNKTIVNVTT